jgi:hypothetical protein
MDKRIEKPKMGRKTVMTDRVLDKLESALCGGFSVSAACYFAGVGTSTFYEYKSLDKDFADRMRRAEEYATFRARQVVLQAIDKGNVRAAMWFLERKARLEFAPPKAM